MPSLTRRALLQTLAAAYPALTLSRSAWSADAPVQPLQEFNYDQIRISGALQAAQRENVTAILMGFDEDSLLKPFRAMAGQHAPGVSLGGWYEWNPSYDFHHDDIGFAPAHTFGQWVSALARLYASSRFDTPQPALQARVLRLNQGLAQSISPDYFAHTRFAAYSLDKLVCGLMDAHHLAADSTAFATLDKVTTAAEPSLPGHAVDREIQWKLGYDLSWMWDESYTLPENLFLVSTQGTGTRYRQMAEAYLDDKTWFAPLAQNINILDEKHGYSYVNSLNSAMQAYFITGSQLHLAAARNFFDFLEKQSFATGGWAPDELLRKPGSPDLLKSLISTHNTFETPCGAFAHMKLTRYLLRATRDGRYGDSMERVFHNTILGVLPLHADGRAFYYADYNQLAQRIYSVHRWPCCSGTLPQVVADYGINTYLQAPGEVWVNLYQPSQLRANVSNQPIQLTQTGTYPEDETIQLALTTPRPVPFKLHLRIPAWAGSQAILQVNGKLQPISIEHGFTSVERTWRTGDTVTLTLPMSLRLESFPANPAPATPTPNPIPDTPAAPLPVAILRGPIVLFPIRQLGETGPLTLTRQSILNALRTGPREWTITTASGPRTMVPFTDIGDRLYTTYVTLA